MATKSDTSAPAEALSAPAYDLVVIHPFGDYGRGSRISDPAEVIRVLEGENARHVNKVSKQ